MTTHPPLPALALVLLAALATRPAQAGADDEGPLTRAQVHGQLQQARAEGRLPVLDAEGRYVQPALTMHDNPDLSRAQVRDELATARHDGTLANPDAEGRLMGGPPSSGSSLTRAEVRAEARDAVRHGDTDASDDHGRTWRELFPKQYPPER